MAVPEDMAVLVAAVALPVAVVVAATAAMALTAAMVEMEDPEE
jgi:hypothetical protein